MRVKPAVSHPGSLCVGRIDLKKRVRCGCGFDRGSHNHDNVKRLCCFVADEKEKYDPNAFRDSILQGFSECESNLEQVSSSLKSCKFLSLSMGCSEGFMVGIFAMC